MGWSKSEVKCHCTWSFFRRSSNNILRSIFDNFFDELHSDFEDRFVSLGESDQQRILLVIHTDRDAVIRIISVRIATRKERQTYEQQS